MWIGFECPKTLKNLKKVRIILHFFTSFNLDYINPTPSIYTTIFAEVADFTHSIDEKNKTDVSSEDICLITPFVFIGSSLEVYEQTKKHLTKHYNLYKLKFPTFEQCVDFTNVAVTSMKVAMATVITLLDYDVHALVRRPFFLNLLRENNMYVILAGEELYDFEFHKKTLQKDMDESVIVEIKNFFNEFKTRIISLPHALFQSEINQNTQCFDFIRYSIPGVNYLPRKNFKYKVFVFKWL